MRDLILGLDVDGTLAKSINNNISTSTKQKMNSIYNKINFKQTAGFQSAVLKRLMILYFNMKWKNWKDIEPVDKNIKHIIENLSEKFYIKIITSAPGKLTGIKNWLSWNNIFYDEFIQINSGDKHKYCDILVDDRPEVVKTMDCNGKLGILLDIDGTGHLEENKNIKICKSWEEIYKLLSAI